jgi:hypothetical protein
MPSAGKRRQHALRIVTLCGQDPYVTPERAAAPPSAGADQGPREYADESSLPAKIFTIFEGTSEIQRMLIGRAVTGLDVR